MAPLIQSVIDAIKKARKKKGLTQRALSQKTKIPQSHISKIEKGLVDLHISSLVQISRALEMEVMLVPVSLVLTVQALQDERGIDYMRQVPMYQLGKEDSDHE